MNNAKVQELLEKYCTVHEEYVLWLANDILEGLEIYEKALAKGCDSKKLLQDHFDIYDDDAIDGFGGPDDGDDLEYALESLVIEVFSKVGEDSSLRQEFWSEIKSTYNPENTFVFTKLLGGTGYIYTCDYSFDNTAMLIRANEIIDGFNPWLKSHTRGDIAILHEALQKAIKAYGNSNVDSPYDKMMKLFDMIAIGYTAYRVLPFVNEEYLSSVR